MTFHCNMVLPANLRVRITTEREDLCENRAKLIYGAYLPGVSFVDKFSTEPDFTVTFVSSGTASVVQSKQDIELQGPYHHDGTLLDIAHIVYCKARLHWLKARMYPVHSACVGRSEADGYVLIVGHSGSGKSSVATDLLTERNWKLFSGNKTLVEFSSDGVLSAIAGTRTMTMELNAQPPHVCILPSVECYGGRYGYAVDSKSLESASRVRINRIVLAKWSEGEDRCAQTDGVNAIRKLYPYFLDCVNADTVLCGGQHVIFANPPPGSRTALSKSLDLALKHISVWDIAGKRNRLMRGVHDTLRAEGKPYD